MNRSADVSNIPCLTACVFGLHKKKGGVEGERSPPRGGRLGGDGALPICKLLNLSPLSLTEFKRGA